MAKTKSNYYINQKEFYNEIKQSKEDGKLTRRSLEMLILLTDKLSNALSYKNPDDKDDCKAFALKDLVNYWDRFNPERSQNAFAYFTQVCKNGLAKGYRALHSENFEGKVYFDRENGIYNV